MIFFQEKQNRRYLGILSVFCTLLLSSTCLSAYVMLLKFRDIVFLREQQIVSSLLADGIPAAKIAAACSSMEVTEQAADFLFRIGHQEQTSVWFFPIFRSFAGSVYFPVLLLHAAFCAVLFGCSIRYMRRRELLYQQAAELVERFAEGDFSGHLPMGDQRGSIYRLFISIDQLARALRSRYEGELASREFLKDMISDISHQIKTPLAALSMYTDIMAAEPDQPDTVRTFAEKSAQSLMRMENLIQSLLKIARLDAGQISFERIQISVRELALRGAEELRIRAAREGKNIVIEGDAAAKILCDPAWTAEAVGNLIKNALDHTEEGGVVRIFWECSPAMIRLSVEDNGCGIAQEDIHRIFRRFYRSGRSRDRQGVGLGLSLSKAIIEGQNGTLSVRSRVGEGSTFAVSFLLQDSSPA
ncbi:MAG: sensor histidine kinase [Lachnospiraceae bacterium]|nr:sensor histidine kinase [Lachnospiraceae bacterium]